MAITCCPLCGGRWSTWTLNCQRCGTPQHIAVGMMAQRYYAEQYRRAPPTAAPDPNVIDAELLEATVLPPDDEG